MPRPINAKGRPFSWSYSATTDYDTCPFQYAARRFYCTMPFVETEPIIWGNRVHKAAENMLKCIPVTDEEAYAPVKPYVETMLRSGLAVTAELEIALTEDLKPASWFSKAAWLRMKIDVVLQSYDRTAVNMFDWKTGKRIKDDEDQLRLCGAGLSIIHPETKTYDGKYIWTAHQQVTGIRPFTDKDVPHIWEDFLARAHRMSQAWQQEKFPPRPNGLCRQWCQVSECRYHGVGR